MGSRAVTFCFLLAIWLVFSGHDDWFHLTLGVLSAGFVTWISGDLLFREHHGEALIGIAGRLWGYLWWLLWQIVLANFHLLKLSLTPSGLDEVEPRVVKFRTHLRSDFARFLLANSITLTPGTVTLRIEGDVFYVHAISQKSVDGLDGEMERRIADVFHDEFVPGGDSNQAKEDVS